MARLEALVEAQNIELEALRATNKEIEHTAEYLRVMSHQMRTPLGTILAAIGLMETGQQEAISAEECAEYAGFITTAVRRLDAIAESACILGCLNAGMFPTHRNHESAGLNPQGEATEKLEHILRAAIQQARLQEESNRRQGQTQCAAKDRPKPQQQVQVHVQGMVPPLLLTARASGIVEICLTQLISNAIKFSMADRSRIQEATQSPQQTHVLATASLSPSGDHCCIRIRDHGMGIAEDMGARMFHPFRRGANARGTTGEGMGLYIARRCAQLLGGTLEIINFPNPGTPVIPNTPTSPLEAPGSGVLARLQFPLSGNMAPPV